MSVELWIDDGNPWYLSPDIWVVPSDDPNDPPGIPFENISAYVWANVHNRGSTAISNATVKFYWADPSTAITRSTAHPIGTSSVSLLAGETKPVLCVTPWIPQYVNGGHECLIAEAYGAADPLPPYTPTDPFHVPADRHIAQRNISVGKAAAAQMMIQPFMIGNFAAQRGERVTVQVKRASLDLLRPLLRGLGLDRIPEEAPEIREFGVMSHRCGQPVDGVGKQQVALPVERFHQHGMALVVRMPPKAPAGTAALFLVEQLAGEETVGGIAVLALAGDAPGGPKQATTTRKGPAKRRS